MILRKLNGLILVSVGGIATVIASCTNSSDNSSIVGVSTQIISINSAAQNQFQFKNGIWGKSVSSFSENNDESNVVIDSYKIVLSDIGISTGTELTGIGSDVVYQCTGGSDEACYVDLAEAGAVDGLLDSSTYNIRPGEYKFAMIGTCVDNTSNVSEQGSYIKVKTRILSGGNWYYTTVQTGDSDFFLKQLAGSTWSSPVDYAEAKIWVSGCRTYNVFQSPITLTEAQTVSIKMFYDLRRSLTFKNNGMTQDGCTSPKGQSHIASGATEFQVCGGYPYLAGMITDEKPDLHRYIVSTAANNAQVFGIYFAKNTTTSVGGYNYAYVGTGAFQNPENFNQVLKKVSNTSGSTSLLTIVTYGGQTSSDVIDDLPGGFNTTEFPILDTVNSSQAFTATDGSGATINATATRIE